MFNDLPDPFSRFLAEVPEDKPVLIAGPTASGKSGLALRLAQAQGRSIVNADALQVYAAWRVLSARPPAEEEALVPHKLYGHVAHDEDYSAGHWLRDVAQILLEDPRPVIVGGTGLNFWALTEGLAEIPATPTEIRAEADLRKANEGAEALLAELDAATAARIDQKNPARIQRAWEVLRATGRGLASWQDETGPALLPLSDCVPLVLMPDADWLGARIDQRFDLMIRDGALDEVRDAQAIWEPTRPFARAIGAPELMAMLQGEMSLSEAREAACIATRRYAKRQRTWMRNRLGHWPMISLP